MAPNKASGTCEQYSHQLCVTPDHELSGSAPRRGADGGDLSIGRHHGEGAVEERRSTQLPAQLFARPPCRDKLKRSRFAHRDEPPFALLTMGPHERYLCSSITSSSTSDSRPPLALLSSIRPAAVPGFLELANTISTSSRGSRCRVSASPIPRLAP